jgi:hypothetical protein
VALSPSGPSQVFVVRILVQARIPALSEGVKKSLACHPERSEGSPQFFVSGRNKSNCGDPSLRSELVTFLGFWPFSGT